MSFLNPLNAQNVDSIQFLFRHIIDKRKVAIIRNHQTRKTPINVNNAPNLCITSLEANHNCYHFSREHKKKQPAVVWQNTNAREFKFV